MGQGIVQALLGLISSSLLKDALVQHLGFIAGSPIDSSHFANHSGTEVGAYRVAVTIIVNVPPALMVVKFEVIHQ